MSTSVAPLPTGGGVTVIAEHRGHREQEGRPDAEPESAGEAAPAPPAPAAPSLAAPPPPADDEFVPAETLFEATLMASRLPMRGLASDELRLRQGHDWTPPDSSLRLKDKLI